MGTHVCRFDRYLGTHIYNAEHCVLSAFWLNVIENERAYPGWAEWCFEEDLANSSAAPFLIMPIAAFIASLGGASLYHLGMW